MTTQSNSQEGSEIFAFGHDPEQKINFPSDEATFSNGSYAPCHSCYAHFTRDEMAVGTPNLSGGAFHNLIFSDWIQLCNSCRDKEIERLSDIVGVSNDEKLTSLWVLNTGLLYARNQGDAEDVKHMKKLLFLLQSREEQILRGDVK